MGIKNLKTSGAPIELDKARSVRFTFEGLGWLAEKYGSVKTALDKFGNVELLQEMSAEGLGLVVDFLYAGLMHEDESLERKFVARMIDLSNIKDVIEAIGNGIRGSMPQPGEGETPQKA